MGIFTKRENVKFRDEEGRPLDEPVRTGDTERTPVSDKLLKQYKKESPSRWDKYKEQRAYEREIHNKAYQKAKTKTIEARAKRQAKERYKYTPTERLSRTMGSYTSYSPRNNYNPIGSMFDSGIKPMKFDITDNWGLYSKPKRKTTKRKKKRRKK